MNISNIITIIILLGAVILGAYIADGIIAVHLTEVVRTEAGTNAFGVELVVEYHNGFFGEYKGTTTAVGYNFANR